MKRIALSLLTCLASICAIAQWNTATNPPNISFTTGRVGVSTTTPQKNFEVNAGNNNYASIGTPLAIGEFSGLHFGYLELANTLYRKSAIVFERLDGSARGKIHILNNGGWNANSATLADSRLTIDYNGNIGFGISSPAEAIHVNALGNSGRVNARIGRWASFGETYSGLATIIGTNVKASNESINRMEFIESTPDGGKAIKMQYNEGISFHTYLGSVVGGNEFSGQERMRIDNYGNVLINTHTSSSTTGDKLRIGGEGYLNIRLGRWGAFGETSGGIATVIGNNVKASNSAYNKLEFIDSTPDGGKLIKLQYDEGITFHTHHGNTVAGTEFNGYERMRIDNYGRVGIGTTSPDAALTVKGTIHTQEVKVDLLGAVAPDYVFEPTYELTPLSEVENYIKQHKHLPEVPSAKEMEEQGVNLKEMNMLLLKKVEELTLHVIELKKNNDNLTKRLITIENGKN